MKFPKHCRVCGSRLDWIIDANGFWEDTGERRISKWLKCPNWKGGRIMYSPGAYISYTALELNRAQTDFVDGGIGYTRYQTCDYTVVY